MSIDVATAFTDPIALFTVAVAALNAGRWADVAACCDPVSVRAFRRQFVEQFTPSDPTHQMTAEDYRRYAPDMPDDVVEYMIAQHRRQADPMVRLREEIPNITSLDELSALDAPVLFARWLDGRSLRQQIERLVASGRVSRASATASLAAATGAAHPYVPLGAVPDGDDIAYVLYRTDTARTYRWSGDAASWLARRPADEQRLLNEIQESPHAAPCRRQPDGTWRLVVDHDFLRVSSVRLVDVRPGDRDATGDSDTA